MTPGAFVVGTSQLLSITPDGYITACGRSGPATDELRAIYDEAFTPRCRPTDFDRPPERSRAARPHRHGWTVEARRGSTVA